MDVGGNANFILIASMLAVGVADDLRSKKVHNHFIILFFVIAILASLAQGGTTQFLSGLGSFAIGFVVILPLYLLKVFGGGDVKLFLSVSPLLSWDATLTTLFASLFWGALLGVTRALLQGRGSVLYSNLISVVLFRTKPLDENLNKIPYTVALFFGFLSHQALMGVL